MKKKKVKEVQQERSIEVITGITHEKMNAITELSKAVFELSKALNSTNSVVTINNCNINNSTPAIFIGNKK